MSTATESLEPVPRKRQPTQEETESFHQALIDIVEEVRPATVRQVFYRAVGPRIIEKTEQDYRRVQHALTVLRESGRVSWHDIIDGTRRYVKPDSWASPSDALDEVARSYRKNLWADASHIPEIWIEKDALSGVLEDVTAEWDVRLFAARGFSSRTFLHSAAEHIVRRSRRERSQATVIYHLGDWDPSGRDAFTAIRDTLNRYVLALGGQGDFQPDGVRAILEAIWQDSDAMFPDGVPALGAQDLVHYVAETLRIYRADMSDADRTKAWATVEAHRQIPCLEIVHLGVSQKQIDEYDLPLRPMKKAGDKGAAKRNARFVAEHGEGCVELDAIHPDELRGIVRRAIEQHLPQDKLDKLRIIEEQEREGLLLFAKKAHRQAEKLARGAA